MKKLLIVEDEEIIRKGIVLSIDWAASGCIVAGEAADGEEGLAQFAKLDPDCIITDLKMPHMDGLEMIRCLRERGCQAPIIILTAYDSFSYAQQAIKLGVSDFILKPFHDGELEEAVRRLLSQDSAPIPELSIETPGARSKYVLEALSYVADHYGEAGISVSEISRDLSISEGHLCHTFKKETGMTLVSYLTRYRIHKAMELLRDCRIRIYEATEQVGYRDIAYFSNTFKKLTGMTPSEYQDRAAAADRNG